MSREVTSQARTAIVTGAAQGIGRAIAERLVHEGCHVVLGDVNGSANEAAALEIDPTGKSVLAVPLDVRDEEAWRDAFRLASDQWGGVGILVNNAARTAATPVWEIHRDEWNEVFSVNALGTFFGCRVAGAHMRESGFGRIVNVASLAGQWGQSPTGAHYAASKAALISLTRVFAHELAGSGVTVNAVSPAAIETPQVLAMPADRIQAYVDSAIPARRLGTPAEVAATVAFLASEEGGFITGATIDVNGGALMR